VRDRINRWLNELWLRKDRMIDGILDEYRMR